MLLSFDVVQEAIAEHDDWHTHEHLPERLSIPGFMRGSRWVALTGGPRYFVLYEVEALATLTSEAYLQRLNNPSPWTSKMMAHYRGMRRGFCSVTASFGAGLGGVCLLLRFKPAAGTEPSLRKWLWDEALPTLPAKPGFGSVRLFEGALTPAMTNEQRIRGADAGVDWALVVTGYSQDVLARLLDGDFLKELAHRCPAGILSGAYRLEYSLSASEIEQ